MTAPIWNTYGGGVGFGDIWASMHFAIRYAEQNKIDPLISRWLGHEHNYDGKSRMEEMAAIINSPIKIQVVNHLPTKDVGGGVWGTEYYPCKVRWKNTKNNIISTQFDGVSSSGLKNPTSKEIRNFHLRCFLSKLIPRRVGLPYSIQNCARILANSENFIGACSGMSCLALAVGVPVHVLEYEVKIAWWYGPNKIKKHSSVESFFNEVGKKCLL